MNTENIQPQESDEIEISIADIVKFIKNNFKKIALCAGLFGIVGAIYALLAQKEFESKMTLLPESATKSSGLSSLASVAGVDIAGAAGSEAIRSDIYPNVLQSTPFALYLLKQNVYPTGSKAVSLETFLNENNAGIISKLVGGKQASTNTKLLDPQQLSKTLEVSVSQEGLIKTVLERVGTTYDRKTGIITINGKMPDPVVAAGVVQIAGEYLKKYIAEYRTGKTKEQVRFLAERVGEAKSKYQSAETALARFKDGNRFLILASPKVEEARLTADFMFAQNVYNELQRQFEQLKIKLQEETPVFKILDPAKIPLKRSEPKRTVIVLACAFVGAIFGVLLGLWPTVKDKLGLVKK